MIDKLRRALALLTLIVFVIPLLSKVYTYVDFKLNQDFIAKVLCINKDKPSTKCEGACYLSQQLKKTEDQESSEFPNSSQRTIEIQLFVAEENSLLPEYLDVMLKAKIACYKQDYAYKHIKKVFHPPQAV